MAIFAGILLYVGVIIIGQILKEFTNNTIFYFVHMTAIIMIFGWGVYATMEVGALTWPLWVFTMLYMPPVLVSMLIGFIEDKMKWRNEIKE